MDTISAAARQASINLQGLDDPILTDSTPTFTGGMHSYGAADQLETNQARNLLNVDIRDGTAATRRGTTSLPNTPFLGFPVQGLFWFSTPALNYLFAAAETGLYVWNESAWGGAPGSTWASASNGIAVQMAQLVNLLFLADGTTNLWSYDGTTSVDLGNNTGIGDGAKPPVGKYLISDGYRLWSAGITAINVSDPYPYTSDILACSLILDGTTWNSTYGSIRVGSGDGDPITGIISWDQNQIVVFKRNSIYIVQADPSTTNPFDSTHGLQNASITCISKEIGCVSHRSIARVGPDIWFLSDFGVMSVGRVVAQDQREVRVAISLVVQDIIDRINWPHADTATAFFWGNRYMLALPLDNDTTPTSILVYHTQRQGFSGLWTGWSPACWALSKFNGQERLNFGRADGQVWRFLDYILASQETTTSYQDVGADVATSIQTRAMIFGDPIFEKSPFTIGLEFLDSTAVASCTVSFDETDALPVELGFRTDDNPLFLPFLLPAILPNSGVNRRTFPVQQFGQFRSEQVQIDSPSGKLVVRAVIATAFLDTLKLEQ